MPRRRVNYRRRGKRLYKTRINYRKKSYKRRLSKLTRVVVRNRVQPDTVFVKLTQEFIAKLTNTEATIGDVPSLSFYIHGNDVYDPDGTFGSGQPTGFDQWIAFYNNFLVHYSKATVEYVAYTDSASVVDPVQPVRCTLVPVTESSYSGVNFQEQPYARTKLVLPGGQASGWGSTNKVVISNRMYTKKMLGVKDLLDDPNVKGTASASPNNLFYWLVYAEGTQAALAENASSITAFIRVRVTYYTQFLERKAIVDS